MNDIGVGVIGAENRGKIAQLAHQPENGVFFRAACTLNIERILHLRERFGPDVYLAENYRDLLLRNDVNAVFVCSPDHLHEEHAVAALTAGKHVYLEKPMSISIAGCDRILRAAKDNGAKLYVGHNMRFFSVMQKMKEMVDAGAIGKVQAIWCRHFISYGGDAYFRDWHSERRFSHGLLLQKGAHDIDIIHWLAGAYTTRVAGMGKLSVYDQLPRRKADALQPKVEFNRSNWPPRTTGEYSPVIDVEDHSMIFMVLGNGVQATYLQCHYTPDDVRNYTIIGTEGRIENYGDHSTPELPAEIHLWNRRTGYAMRGHEIVSIPMTEGSHGGADPLIVQDFIEFLRGKQHRGASPLDARMAVAAGYLGTESLRNGNTPYDLPAFDDGTDFS